MDEKGNGFLYSLALVTIPVILTKLLDFLISHFGGKSETVAGEARERGKAEQKAEIYEKELNTTRELIRECNNEVQQLDTILTLNEIVSEDRKVNKKITCQE